MAPPVNINEALAMLEGKAVVTSKGNYVNMEDVKKLFAAVPDTAEETDQPKPKNFEQARQLAKDDPMFKEFPKPSLGLGRAIVATEPPSAARA